MFQDTYDASGRVVQQVLPDGGTVKFALHPGKPFGLYQSGDRYRLHRSALGNQTTYRFNIQGFLTDVTDALGQTKSFQRDPGTNQVLKVSGPVQCEICGAPGRGSISYTYDSQGNLLYRDGCPGQYHHLHLRCYFQSGDFHHRRAAPYSYLHL